jgi:hypothetical protein
MPNLNAGSESSVVIVALPIRWVCQKCAQCTYIYIGIHHTFWWIVKVPWNNNNNKYTLIKHLSKDWSKRYPSKVIIEQPHLQASLENVNILTLLHGAQEEKLRSPKPVRVLFTEYWTSPEDYCVCRWFVLRRRMPSKYLRASPHIILYDFVANSWFCVDACCLSSGGFGDGAPSYL